MWFIVVPLFHRYQATSQLVEPDVTDMASDHRKQSFGKGSLVVQVRREEFNVLFQFVQIIVMSREFR